MTVIGIVLLAVGLVVVVSLTLADPVLLSRINGEAAQGGSGRHIRAPRIRAGESGQAAEAEVVLLRPGHGAERRSQAA
ncbi:hypothetical protein [Planobispora takensis]|uniref:Uncharacterized protein n=1 Tax=Planobispora takensis TaxID=1367882 RepID=A0A8J3ST40_9ACTN|nr:hypothetical protein [Planobispora takensis]GIH99060.1 hypothetical protein Pta02_10690 [Planobispora takensis]